MKIIGISDNLELAVGLKFAGIECEVLENGDILEKVKAKSNNKDVGIIVITENLYKKSEEDLNKFKKNNKLPLILKLTNK